MSIVGEAINWLKIRRPVSNATWIADRMALQKSVQLCSTCLYKMPRRWKAIYHYEEFTQYHGEGQCDGCRHDDTVTLFLSTDDPWHEECERQARVSQALDHEESRARAFSVEDRRRLGAV